MANTWNGMTFTNIARMGFKAFTARLAPLNVFATDFSDEMRDQGNVVNTRIVPVSQAAVDLQTGTAVAGKRSDANVIEDTNTSTVAVTLNQQPITGFFLTDEEAHEIGTGVWQDTRTKLLQNKAFAVADFMLDYCFNLVTAASYGAAVHTGAASAFDLDDVVDIGTSLEESSSWKFMGEESLVLKPSYVGALKKDGAIQDLSASGIPIVQNGDLDRYQVDRFRIVSAPTLPPAAGTPASENLVGMACKPAGIACAMRAVRAQATDKLMAYEVMTDPETGATLVYRAWYDEDFGKVYHTFETLFGASVGQAEALKRIVSA